MESFTRTTHEGELLHYCLRVIQQPERARACGFGANSSADRRPLDPPPVIELQVLQQANESSPFIDVTFSYQANFFLYAQLESNKSQTSAVTLPPLLTGVCVGGVTYLNQPRRAGYFVFPDLAIKKEGTYRLRFSLFEESRESPEVVSFRGSIQSDEFHVYSAKKFPGLRLSTPISQTLAEQGCRVRNRKKTGNSPTTTTSRGERRRTVHSSSSSSSSPLERAPLRLTYTRADGRLKTIIA
ncbi:Velvet factor [Ascosphaera apis ARSEF 7405]|uniref:Velvet factor n=1 Tax=Ascosphaera apis ARSEF 7405 TaxID=392613 RepID=A0A167V8E0_9EURO|nr:Velvet factor [Ascosphaera apis ARSEF 7405]